MSRYISEALMAVTVAAMVACVKYEEPATPAETFVKFGYELDEMTEGTRSRLTDSNIEDKLVSITLAAYCDGYLAEKAYFTSTFNQMTLSLATNKTYEIYAIANLGDKRNALPVSESDLSGMYYDIPSYSTINTNGLPMTGHLSYTTGSSASKVIPLKRKFAKITAILEFKYDRGLTGTIKSIKLTGLNKRLSLFGDSKATSSTMLSEYDYYSGSSTGGSFVFYVPENMQGDIGSATSSLDKNPDRNAAINAKKDVLTYMETTVELSGTYTGTVVYRSYMGYNQRTNCDVTGNMRYDWYVDYYENNLQYNDWKIQTGGMSDQRYINVTTPYYVLAGDRVKFTDVVSSNIDKATLIPSVTDTDGIVQNSNFVDCQSGYIDVKETAQPGKRASYAVVPENNPGSLRKTGEFVVYTQSIAADKSVLHLDAGDNLTGDVDITYMYNFGSYKSAERYYGRKPSEWDESYSGTGGYVTRTYNASNDRITYTVDPQVVPGTYTATYQTVNRKATATTQIIIDDTRYICTDNHDPNHPAPSSDCNNREYSIRKADITSYSTWRIGHAYGQYNNGAYHSKWRFGATVSSPSYTRTCEGLSSGYLTQKYALAESTTYTISTSIPKGDYRFEIAWSDNAAIKDYAILHVTDSYVTGVTINNSPAYVLVGGETKTLTATVTPSNSENMNLNWSIIEGNEHASIDSEGKVTGLSAGSAIVLCEAADGHGARDTSIVRVERAYLSPTIQTAYVGSRVNYAIMLERYDGTVSDVTNTGSSYWQSNNYDIIRPVSGVKGAFNCQTTVGRYENAISARWYDMVKYNFPGVTLTGGINVIANSPVSIEPSENEIYLWKGQDKTLTATVTYANGTTGSSNVTWTTSDSGVATYVTSSSKARGAGAGLATLTATATGSSVSTGVAAKVSHAAMQNKSLIVGQSGQMAVDYYDYSAPSTARSIAGESGFSNWSSTNTSAVTVSNGTVTAVGSGTSTISCDYTKTGYGTIHLSATVSVTARAVTKVEIAPSGTINLWNGEQTDLQATVTYNDGTTSNTATWSSNATTVAKVSEGTVTAEGVGKATITAAAGGKSATVTVNVNGFEISPASVSVTVETSADALTFKVKKGSDGSTVNVPVSGLRSLVSSNTSIATVNASTAVVTGGSTLGTTSVIARYENSSYGKGVVTASTNVTNAAFSGTMTVLEPQPTLYEKKVGDIVTSIIVWKYVVTYQNGVEVSRVGPTFPGASDFDYSITSGSGVVSIINNYQVRADAMGEATVHLVLKSEPAASVDVRFFVDENIGTGGEDGEGGGGDINN